MSTETYLIGYGVVLAALAAFVGGLGVIWARGLLAEVRSRKRGAPTT